MRHYLGTALDPDRLDFGVNSSIMRRIIKRVFDARERERTMWAVMYGGLFDGHAILVEETTQVVKFPKSFDLKKHGESHDYESGEFVYERADRSAIGWNVSGTKQRGIAFTPRSLETMG